MNAKRERAKAEIVAIEEAYQKFEGKDSWPYDIFMAGFFAGKDFKDRKVKKNSLRPLVKETQCI